MCGFAGIYDHTGRREIDAGLLAAMNDSLAHRGPDGTGSHREPGLGLGHRRLSVIDPASGQQPMYNEDRKVAVVFNGEIYNFRALMAELERYGHRFRTRCDTEVIAHAWEQWGARCVERLRGMFAFALWDSRVQTLFLARDRLGIKPLHYAWLPDGQLLFGSEIKALLAHPALERGLDPCAVADYFTYGYVPDPRSIFLAVRKLAPGHTLSLRRNAPVPEPCRYWDLPQAETLAIAEDEAGVQLQRRLNEAVGLHSVADVPLGAFLSGGVDSSAVVAMMAGQTRSPVTTCSMSFADPRFDEAAYARQVASLYQTRHHCGQAQIAAADAAGLYDEPFADSSAIPTYQLCALARRQVTVALSGDGGDEIMAGYTRYHWLLREERLRALLPRVIRRPVFGLLAGAWPHAHWMPRPLRARPTFAAMARDTVEAYAHIVALSSPALRRKLFSAPFQRILAGYQPFDLLHGHADGRDGSGPLALIQYLDLKTYLPGDILTKVDRASMAHGLEVRVPLLDHELVEWTARLPQHLRLREGQGKYLFKRAMENRLPHDILYRKKMGFAVPLAAWLRGPLRSAARLALLGPVLADSGYVQTGYIEQLLAEHDAQHYDHSAVLWSLLMFEAFLRHTQAGVLPVIARAA